MAYFNVNVALFVVHSIAYGLNSKIFPEARYQFRGYRTSAEYPILSHPDTGFSPRTKCGTLIMCKDSESIYKRQL